jgi:hypothetical protein
MYGHPAKGYMPDYKPSTLQIVAGYSRRFSVVARSLLERLSPVSVPPAETGFFSTTPATKKIRRAVVAPSESPVYRTGSTKTQHGLTSLEYLVGLTILGSVSVGYLVTAEDLEPVASQVVSKACDRAREMNRIFPAAKLTAEYHAQCEGAE